MDSKPPAPKINSDLPILSSEDLHKQSLYINAASSDNTRLAYQSAIQHYLSWGGLLPASPPVLTKYLLEHAETLNPRTLDLRLTALSQWHCLQKFYDPTRDPSVKKVMTGIRRTHGKPKKKARPISLNDLHHMIQSLSTGKSNLMQTRNKCLILIGFFGAFRGSELASLDIHQISREQEGLLVTLTKSKTDQEGKGLLRAIPKGMPDLCPCEALSDWLAISGIQSGFVFRSINRWGQIGNTSLSKNSITKILRQVASQSGLTYADDFSSHSFRRGLSTEAAKAEVRFEDIKRQGGWKNDTTVREYIDEGSVFENNAGHPLLEKLYKMGCKDR